MRSFAVILAFCFATVASAFQPRIGLWANASESGSGYMMDIQNGTLVLTAYSYGAGGASQWYLASGPLTNDGHSFTATLDKYQDGQCISCAYRAPTSGGNDGTITITFVSETIANLSLPGGRTTVIQPFDFGYGPLPSGLLGEWIFVYDIGNTTLADRYDFTDTASGTSNGSGLAIDHTRLAGCELQVRGSLTGMVICADVNTAGSIENGFAFQYGLDETYGGVWISPTTGNQAAMKGFRVTSNGGGGLTRSNVSVSDERLHALKAGAVPADAGGTAGPASPADFAELIDKVRSALGVSQR